MRRLALAALAVLAAVPVPAGAAPGVSARRQVVDAAMVVGWDDLARPTAGVVVTFARYTTTTVSGSTDELYRCVSLGTRTRNETGCAVVDPAAVTEGLVHPERAVLRGRVPVRERRGGWVEVDLVATASDSPGLPTPHRGVYAPTREVAPGVEAPYSVTPYAGAYVIRPATVSGTVRTDFGLRFAPVPSPRSIFQPLLIRWDLTRVDGETGLAKVTAAFAESAPAYLPA